MTVAVHFSVQILGRPFRVQAFLRFKMTLQGRLSKGTCPLDGFIGIAVYA